MVRLNLHADVMTRLLIAVLFLSCAYSYAQDSFSNPYSFSYEIESSTEYNDSILSPQTTRLDVNYDNRLKTPICLIRYNGKQMYEGRILDMRIGQNEQVFVLEKYFADKYNACLLIVREAEEISNMKIGMIYYANQKEDPEPKKTCYCLLLKDAKPEF